MSFYQPIEFKDNLRTIEARFPKNLRTTEAHFELQFTCQAIEKTNWEQC